MEAKRQIDAKDLLRRFLSARETGILIPLVLLVVLVGAINPVFYSFGNIIDVLRNTSFTLIVALGMTYLLISNAFDMSVGSFLALGSLIVGMALKAGWPIPLAIFGGILIGVIGGFVNGVAVVKLNIPPFITTLGTLYMARGLVLVLTKGTPIYPLPKAFDYIGQKSLFGVPHVVIIAGILSIIADYVLKRTVFGRTIYAVGGNEEAARLSGINVQKVRFAVFVITTILAVLSGMLTASRLGSSQPSIGDGFELQVIAASIIGGTSLFGGAGTILGTIFGALFMNVMSNGMTLVRVSAYWEKFVIGAVILFAVGLDQYKRRKSKA